MRILLVSFIFSLTYMLIVGSTDIKVLLFIEIIAMIVYWTVTSIIAKKEREKERKKERKKEIKEYKQREEERKQRSQARSIILNELHI